MLFTASQHAARSDNGHGAIASYFMFLTTLILLPRNIILFYGPRLYRLIIPLAFPFKRFQVMGGQFCVTRRKMNRYLYPSLEPTTDGLFVNRNDPG